MPYKKVFKLMSNNKNNALSLEVYIRQIYEKLRVSRSTIIDDNINIYIFMRFTAPYLAWRRLCNFNTIVISVGQLLDEQQCTH